MPVQSAATENPDQGLFLKDSTQTTGSTLKCEALEFLNEGLIHNKQQCY